LSEAHNPFAGIEAAPEVLARHIVDRIFAEIPSYSRLGQASLYDDVYDQCLQHALLLPAVLRAGRAPNRDDFAFAREAAERRAGAGLPLDAFLHAFRVTHSVMWSKIAEAGDTDAAMPLVSPLIEYIDIASTQVAEAYVRQEQRIRALADRERRDLLENLLVGRIPEENGPHRAAPGLDPTASILVVLARGPDVDTLPDVVDALATTTRGHLGGPLVVARQAEVVALLAAEPAAGAKLEQAQALAKSHTGADLLIGVSSPAAGFAGIRRGYVEAEHALRIATPSRPIVAVGEIAAFDYLLMAADAGTRAVISGKLAGLAGLDSSTRAAIKETIDAYFAEGLNISRTATRLHVHANTIRYRFERIAELTGHNPRHLSGALELLCIMRLSELESR
jgi:PucR C-terminal helix-turn-helix domain/GGDEF-like domain